MGSDVSSEIHAEASFAFAIVRTFSFSGTHLSCLREKSSFLGKIRALLGNRFLLVKIFWETHFFGLSCALVKNFFSASQQRLIRSWRHDPSSFSQLRLVMWSVLMVKQLVNPELATLEPTIPSLILHLLILVLLATPLVEKQHLSAMKVHRLQHCLRLHFLVLAHRSSRFQQHSLFAQHLFSYSSSTSSSFSFCRLFQLFRWRKLLATLPHRYQAWPRPQHPPLSSFASCVYLCPLSAL
mmetsp:Transcript_53462/g.85024  ORF Transcript_53462/g.85024 Transcript_53462/m.85024 type:complete len:239 (-) Transcript_53462:1296-2012(-)